MHAQNRFDGLLLHHTYRPRNIFGKVLSGEILHEFASRAQTSPQLRVECLQLSRGEIDRRLKPLGVQNTDLRTERPRQAARHPQGCGGMFAEINRTEDSCG